MATTAPNGASTSTPNAAPRTSMPRLTSREERLSPVRLRPSTVTPPTVSNSTEDPTTSNSRGTIDTLIPSATVCVTASSIVSLSADVGIRNTRSTSSSRTTEDRSWKPIVRFRRERAPQSTAARRSSSSGRNPTTSRCAPGSDASDCASCSRALALPTMSTRSRGAEDCARARAPARPAMSSAAVDPQRSTTPEP